MRIPRDPSCGCGAPARAAAHGGESDVSAREELAPTARPAGRLPDLTGRTERGFRRWAVPALALVTGAAILGLAWTSATRGTSASP